MIRSLGNQLVKENGFTYSLGQISMREKDFEFCFGFSRTRVSSPLVKRNQRLRQLLEAGSAGRQVIVQTLQEGQVSPGTNSGSQCGSECLEKSQFLPLSPWVSCAALTALGHLSRFDSSLLWPVQCCPHTPSILKKQHKTCISG